MSNRRSTAELANLCRDESERYVRGAAVERGDCYELFRRALVDKDQVAWEAVYKQYERLVAKWVNGPRDQVDGRVNEAFTKFWRAVKPETFVRNFAGIGKVLAFLRLCARSVKIDCIRKEKKEVEIPPDTPSKPPSDPLDEILLDKMRGQIRSRLKDDEERLVYYLSFESGLKPRQIAEKYAKQFENAKQVSRIKERMVKRLRDDLQLRSLWEGLK